MPSDSATTHARHARPLVLAVLGLTLGVVGIAGYFVVVLRLGAWLPGVRNHAVPNWLAIGAGLALSALAIAGAHRGRRLVPALLLGVNGALAAAFAALLYVMSAVPGAPGPVVGVAAPDFALPDQSGQRVRLADFRGNPVVLVFYRGHW